MKVKDLIKVLLTLPPYYEIMAGSKVEDGCRYPIVTLVEHSDVYELVKISTKSQPNVPLHCDLIHGLYTEKEDQIAKQIESADNHDPYEIMEIILPLLNERVSKPLREKIYKKKD